MATPEQIIQKVEQSNFKTAFGFKNYTPLKNIFHLFEGGSALHGARLPGNSDLDICGVFYEPKENIFGLSPFEHYVTSTSDEQKRNTPDDVDITLYSLRRWAALACKGNPTALSYLFAENVMQPIWKGLIGMGIGDVIIAKSAARHFYGFVDSQMKRLLGEKGFGKHGQRPELIENFGYDTKAAMHAVRLAGEGIELMTKGYITYPRPSTGHLIDIRLGKFSLDAINKMVSGLLYELDDATEKSGLRAKPDYAKVNEKLVEQYEEFYYG